MPTNNIKDFAGELGFSLRTLAWLAGITPAYMFQIAGGQVDPSMGIKKTIAEMLNAPLVIVFGEKE